MATGGKTYASRSSQGRLSASNAEARGSGTGDTNRGNLLNLVGNRSIFGRCHLLHIVGKTSGKKDHSVWMVWPSLDSLSATTFSRPGMCRGLRVTSFLEHQVMIAYSGPNIVPPSLFMYDTTGMLSVLNRGVGTLLKLERLLLVPDSLYAACFPEWTRFLWQCARLSERPSLPFYVSVNIFRACFIGCNGWPEFIVFSLPP